jgi:hypothetical protein
LAAFSRGEALDLLDEATTNAGKARRYQCELAINMAYSTSGASTSKTATPKANKPDIDYSLIKSVIAGETRGIRDMQELSPSREQNTSKVLNILFPKDTLKTFGTPERFAETLVSSSSYNDFELIVPNVAESVFGFKEDGNSSNRTKSMYPVRNYQIIEFDKIPIERQCKLHFHLSRYAPLVAVVYSGSQSLHGWYRPEDITFKHALSLGADKAMEQIHQFTRLPGAIRKDNGSEQTVIYLNPKYAMTAKNTRMSDKLNRV